MLRSSARVPGGRNRAEEPRARARVEADLHIVEHRQVGKQADVLKGAGDAERVDLVGTQALDAALALAAGEDDLPLRGGNASRDGVEQRRLARAIGPDQARDLPRLEVEVRLQHGGDAAKALRHRAHTQDRRNGGGRGRAPAFTRAPLVVSAAH